MHPASKARAYPKRKVSNETRQVVEPPPHAFYDPVADEHLHMVGELVLNLQIDSSGQPVLLHMLLRSRPLTTSYFRV